jgi:hypothetical protein
MRVMTEKFSAGGCRKCGTPVGFEDGAKQNACDCDARCESCGRPFAGGHSRLICDECLEEEIEREFSEEFLNTLSGRQFSLLLRDFARRFL